MTGDFEVVTFDLSEANLIDANNLFNEKLTQEEQEEITTIVTELEAVNSCELVDFATQEVTAHHKQITQDELDRLARKNSADSTVYQTKWAITVLKGIFHLNISLLIA